MSTPRRAHKTMSSPKAGTPTHHFAINLDEVVQKVPIFAATDEKFRKELVSRLITEVFEPQSIIMQEGDSGSDMFIIAKGEVEILVGADQNVVAKLGAGSFFGEIALLKDAKRNASVRAVDLCNVCKLAKEDFDDVISGYPGLLDAIQGVAFGRDRAKEVVRKVPIFKDCDDTFLDSLVRRLKNEVLKDGEFVIKEGDVGREMYILYKGEVEVVAGAEGKVLAKLGEGAFFGEIALLKNARRNASIRALTRAETFKLTKEDFDIVLNEYPDYRDRILAVANEKQARREESLLPLHLAVRSGNVAEVEKVIKAGLAKKTKKEQIAIADELRWTSLHEAAHSGHVAIIEYLIEGGAQLEATNSEANTPLHLAATCGHAEAVACLLKHRANLNAMNEDGSTPLHLAARCGEIAVSEMILNNGGSVNVKDVNGNIPLHMACNVGHTECVEFLLRKGSDPNAKNDKGVAPLHDGSLSDQGGVILALVAAGARIDEHDNELATPLNYACNHGAVNTCRELLAKRADPNNRDFNGRTPLHHAAFDGTRANVEALLAAGANIRIKGEDGSPAYQFATLAGNSEIAELLYYEDLPLVVTVREQNYDRLEQLLADGSVDVNASAEGDRWTALHEAVIRGDIAAIDLLVARGASTQAVNMDGATALHLAVGAGQLEAVERLLQHGVGDSINAKSDTGRTALHLAAKAGNADILQALIAAGADTSPGADAFGMTVEDYVKKHTHLSWAALQEFVPRLSVQEAIVAQDAVALQAALKRLKDSVALGPKPDIEFLIHLNGTDENGMSALHWAAHTGFAQGAVILLDAGADLHATYGDGYTALLLAARAGAVDAARVLLDRGADPRAVTENGLTAVLACTAGEPAYDPMLELVLDRGADPNAQDAANQSTLLHSAALLGDEVKIRLLLLAGASKRLRNVSGLSPYEVCLGGARPELAPYLADIHLVCRENDLGSARVMVEKGIAPDMVEERTGEMAVHSAASTGAAETLAFLVETLKQVPDRLAGALAHRDRSGATPLALASAVPSKKCVKILLDAGADPNAGRNADVTPLMLASAKPDGAPVVSALLAAGARVDAADDAEGNTALHAAAAAGSVGAIRALLESPDARALKDRKNKAGLTPAELAQSRGNDEAVRVLNSPTGPDRHERLRLAAAAGEAEGVASLLEEGADPDVADADGRAALHGAAAAGSSECVRLLLQPAGGPGDEDAVKVARARRVNRADQDGKTALMLAAQNGDLETIQALIDAGADLNAADKTGKTALMYAALANKGEAAGLLLSHGAEVDAVDQDGNTALHHAGLAGSAEVAQVLLEQGRSKARAIKNKDGKTPLDLASGAAGGAGGGGGGDHHQRAAELMMADEARLAAAVARGDMAALKRLLDGGLDPAAVDPVTGWTALHHAAERGNGEAVAMLCEALEARGESRDPRAVKGETPLMLAARHGDLAAVRALLASRAAVNEADVDGRTPIMYAAIANKPEVVALLLEHGADVDAADHDGNTALHHAGQHGSAEAATVLLEQGRSQARGLKNKAGLTPQMLAEKSGGGGVVEMLGEDLSELAALLREAAKERNAPVARSLIERGADPGAVTEPEGDGRTALHHAAAAGGPGDHRSSRECAKALVDGSKPGKPRFALLGAKDARGGLTALMLASRAGDLDTIEVLLAAGADANDRDSKGMTAAMHATAGKRPQALALLLEKGALVDVTDSDGNTALHHAGLHGSTDCARVLLEQGRSQARNMRNKDGHTPLELGKYAGGLEPADLDIFEDEATLLFKAAAAGDAEAVKRVLAGFKGPHGGQVDINAAGPAGRTLLGLAAGAGSAEACKALMDAGADPARPDPPTGRTPLHHAAAGGHAEAIRALLARGADQRVPDRQGGDLPLHLAAHAGSAPAVAALIEDIQAMEASAAAQQSASTTTTTTTANTSSSAALLKTPKPGAASRPKLFFNKAGKLARDLAVEGHHDEVVRLLSDPDGKELFLAIVRGDDEAVFELLKSGSNVNAKNAEGETVLHEAVKFNRYDAVRSLVNAGADLNPQRDADKATPLILSAMTAASTWKIGELLVDRGADPNLVDSAGWTALHHACSENSGPMVKALLLSGMRGGGAAALAAAEASDHDKDKTSSSSKDPSIADVDAAVPKTGETPAHLAAEKGAEEALVELSRRRFNRRAKDAQGRTPFRVATEGGHDGCAVLLVDVDTLCELAESGNVKRLEFFLEGGCAVNGARESDGLSLLHVVAADPSLSRITATVIGRGIEVNRQNHVGQTPLAMAAAAAGNRRNVELLCNSGALTNIRDSRGRTALMVGAGGPRDQCVDAVQLVLTHSAPGFSRAEDELGRTALHYAALVGAEETVRVLLHARGDKHVKDKDGVHAYDLAVAGGFDGCAELLRLQEKEATSTDIHEAVRAQDASRLVAILDAGELDANVRDGNDKTPLHVAVEVGVPGLVQLLLERGAKVGACDRWGRTPLHYAAVRDLVKIAQMLLAAGADHRARDLDGVSPLHDAARARAVDVVRVLLALSDAAQLCNVTDQTMQTPLHSAARGGSPHVVLALLRSKSNRYAKDMNGHLPYDVAAASGHTECAILLADVIQLIFVGSTDDLRKALARGGDANVINESGSSALHVAANLNKVEHGKVLLENGALVDRQDRARNTALHIACQKGYTEFTLLLLRSGAGVTMTDRHGLHPIHLACEANDHVAVEELILRGADPSSVDANRSTPLHTCGAFGSNECIRVLRAHGAPVLWKRRDGLMPIDLAVKNGHKETARLLEAALTTGHALLTPDMSRKRMTRLKTAPEGSARVDVSTLPPLPGAAAAAASSSSPSSSPRHPRPPGTAPTSQAVTPRSPADLSSPLWRRSVLFHSPIPPPSKSPTSRPLSRPGSVMTEHKFLYEYKHSACIHSEHGFSNRVFIRLTRYNKDDGLAGCPVCGAEDIPIAKVRCKACGKHMWRLACPSCGLVCEGAPPLMVLANHD